MAAKVCNSSWMSTLPTIQVHHHHHHHHHQPQSKSKQLEQKPHYCRAGGRTTTKTTFAPCPCAAKSGGFNLINSIINKCETCEGKGAVECAGCKGTGRNKKNGNIFERWKCYDCQGFGLKSCPGCGKGGLTPEQRGER